MFRSQLLKQTARAAKASSRAAVPRTLPALTLQRSIHITARLREKKDDGPFEGSFARTDSSVQVEYPEEHDLPASSPVQGRGGLHFKRTLASFSLEGKVGVVTGGARGLGLVMSQAMVISGADVAIVDLNSMFHPWEYTGGIVLRQHRGGSREASKRACSFLQERKSRSGEVSSQSKYERYILRADKVLESPRSPLTMPMYRLKNPSRAPLLISSLNMERLTVW